jgi:hypothetical protein
MREMNFKAHRLMLPNKKFPIVRTLCLAILLCIAATSCRDAETIWSAESASPDGRWIAVAHTERYGGPGTAGIQSAVLLRQVKGQQDAVQVLLLSQDAASVDLKLNWLAPSHLEITYSKPASIDFQAIRCGGVVISVRDLSSGGDASVPR